MIIQTSSGRLSFTKLAAKEDLYARQTLAQSCVSSRSSMAVDSFEVAVQNTARGDEERRQGCQILRVGRRGDRVSYWPKVGQIGPQMGQYGIF